MAQQAIEIAPERLTQALLRQDVLIGHTNVVSRLVGMVACMSLSRGTVLFDAGQQAMLHFILSGTIAVSVAGRVLAELGEGQALGEYPLVFLERHHQATARASEDSIVASVDVEAFRALTREFPELWQPIAKSLARRLEARNRIRLDDVAKALAEYRVRSAGLAGRHRAAAERCARRSKLIGIPATVIAAVVSSSVFASLASDQKNTLVLVATGLASLAAAVLSGLQTFLAYPEQAQAHKNAADGHQAVCRDVDVILGTAESLRGRGQLDEAEKTLADGSARVVAALAALDKSSPNMGDDAGS